MNKLLLIFLTVFFIISVVVVGIFLKIILTPDTPEFFPLHNSAARYTIVKSSVVGQGTEEKEIFYASTLPALYYLEYRGDHVFDDAENKHFFRVLIGKSNADLQSFINKNVVITNGKFTSATQQCIKNICNGSFGPMAVLDIYSLRSVQ